MSSPRLVILPDLKTKRLEGNRFVVTEKFYDGVLEFTRYWPGPVSVFMESSPGLTDNLDNMEVRPDKISFNLGLLDYASLEKLILSGPSVVLGSTTYRQNHLSAWCLERKVPCFYVAEFNLKTRLQIINATTSNILIRLRRYLWEFLQERKQVKAITCASGIQCNGTPSFEVYRKINPSPLLYFDSRMTENMMASDEVVDERLGKCVTGEPLRLIFSGRLLKIKGADHVVSVAEELQKRGMPFEMSICGDGELKASMAAQIAGKGLSGIVKMQGVLDFKTELVPYTQKNADIFVCCHRQGDPSCTYLETMSCGVPIIGYDNPAFLGVVANSKTGWPVPMDRPDQMAQKIFELDHKREEIARAAKTALGFARSHTFEKTFKRRIAHLLTSVST